MEIKEVNTDLMDLVNKKYACGGRKEPVFGRWVPFKGEKNPEGENMIRLSEPLPEDGQQILIHVCRPGDQEVQADTFVNTGGECWLESQYKMITEADYWMPFPAPPRK